MSGEKTRRTILDVRCQAAPDRLWRKISVPEGENLLSLSFFVLSAFGAEGNHLFELRYGGVRYVLFPEDVEEGDLSGFLRIGRDLPGAFGEEALLEETALSDLEAGEGEQMTLLYDFEHGHAFEITVGGPDAAGEGGMRVLSGEGKGILEERTGEELKKAIAACDRAGGPVTLEDGTIWDIRDEAALTDDPKTAERAARMLSDFLADGEE